MGKEDTKNKYTDNIKEHRTEDWTEKPLHGQYPRLVADTSHKNTYAWIKNGYMKKETHGMLTAAQDQALSTRWKENQT